MIVITGAMMAAGAAAGGASGLKALGSFFKNRDALSRKNKQIAKAEFRDSQNFIAQSQQYKAFVDNALAEYEADKANLSVQYEFNGRARQESIEAGLTQLADISDGFIEKAFARQMKLAEATGKTAAAGLTGTTADRFDRVQKGVAQRNTARDGQSMVAAEGAFMFRDKQAQFAQAVANQNAYNRVRPPSFGPAPAAPMARERMADNTGRDLMFGLGTAVLDGAAAGFGAAPKTPFKNNIGSNGSSRAFSLPQLSPTAQINPAVGGQFFMDNALGNNGFSSFFAPTGRGISTTNLINTVF
jgi:hypothetical protein